MKSDFLIAVTQLAAERHLPRDTVLEAIEAALISAYKKDNFAAGQNIAVRLNPGNGEVKVYTQKTVVEEVEDSLKEISLADARRIKADAVLEDILEFEAPLQNPGRIAAQTAKQVVMQRLREAERELVYEEFSAREADIVTGTIQRIDPRQITMDLGRTEGILPAEEQVSMERYRPGQKLQVFILEVRRSTRGPEVIVSRTHKYLLHRLFEMEVPEINNGIIEIKAIAREAGSRSKVAVYARQPGVDPVGSCVGLRGIRIQNVVNELQGEKIDVVEWHKDPGIFISHALSPAQAVRVETNEANQTALVVVPDKLLSLAIGREGQNARLAAKLTGWKVDIKSTTEAEEERLRLVSEGRAARVATAEPSPDEAAEALPKEEEGGEAPVVGVQEREVAEVPEPAAKGEQEEIPEPLVAGTAGSMSPEEELVSLSIEEDTAHQEPEVQEGIAPEVAFSGDIWKVPQQAPGSAQIRFAEDILAPRAPRAKTRGKKGKQGKGDAEGVKTRRTSDRRTQQAPDEQEEWETNE